MIIDDRKSTCWRWGLSGLRSWSKLGVAFSSTSGVGSAGEVVGTNVALRTDADFVASANRRLNNASAVAPTLAVGGLVTEERRSPALELQYSSSR